MFYIRSIIIPTLLMVPMFIWPPDILTFEFWVLGCLMALIYFVLAISYLTQWLRLGTQASEIKRESFKYMIKRGLPVFIFSIAVINMNVTRNLADSYAQKVAVQVSRECDSKGICPKHIPSWERNTIWDVDGSGGGSQTLYGVLMRYVIYYIPSKDRKNFKIMVRHSIDESFDVEGGIGKRWSKRSIE